LYLSVLRHEFTFFSGNSRRFLSFGAIDDKKKIKEV
jgi:hypothetical protein